MHKEVLQRQMVKENGGSSFGLFMMRPMKTSVGERTIRGIYPTVKIIKETGISDVAEERLKQIYTELIGSKKKGLIMAYPYYVSPEQMMQDKAEYAKKGISRGRSIMVMEYVDGVLLVADNPSVSLNKISEVYDNIAFAGAGKYSEFENLRKAGIQHADLKGFVYSREDVTAKSL
jgi:hypothetical protein